MNHGLRTRADIDNIRLAYDRSSSWSGEYVLGRRDAEHTLRPTQHRQASVPTTARRLFVCQSSMTPTTQQYFTDRKPQESPVASIASVPSTTTSQEDPKDAIFNEVLPNIPRSEYHVPPAQSVPTTPQDFSTLFPSDREIFIRHDDTTLDGNMNLRLDTKVHAQDNRTVSMTLFHLRIQDLKDRACSLRRYCRDSGREVCHSGRKIMNAPQNARRPGLQRSLSNAISSVRAMSTPRRSVDNHMKRQDSGYSSVHSMDSNSDEHSFAAGTEQPKSQARSSKTIRLEFSNYAQVDVRCRGVSFNRRYEFEYWGHRYIWKRESKNDRRAVFHLSTSEDGYILGHIKPLQLSLEEEQDEKAKGGWVMPATMKIEDDEILHGQKDLSDVIVAAGLIALVDDAIRGYFAVETTRSRPKVEYIGPRRLLNELLGRE